MEVSGGEQDETANSVDHHGANNQASKGPISNELEKAEGIPPPVSENGVGNSKDKSADASDSEKPSSDNGDVTSSAEGIPPPVSENRVGNSKDKSADASDLEKPSSDNGDVTRSAGDRLEQNGRNGGRPESTIESKGDTVDSGENDEKDDSKEERRLSDISMDQEGGSGFNVKHPYVGKRVRINEGEYKGLMGKVLQIKSRGWWTIDHPELIHKKIDSRSCNLMDAVGEQELREYYAQLNKRMCFSQDDDGEGTQQSSSENAAQHASGNVNATEAAVQVIPPPAQPKKSAEDVAVGIDGIPTADIENNRDGQNDDMSPDSLSASPPDSSRLSSDEPSRAKRRRLSTDSSRGQSPAEDQLFNEAHAVDPGDSVLVSQLLDMNGSTTVDAAFVSQLQYTQGGRVSTLPPVLPASLSHLPQHLKIDVFNRRTGKILSGDDAVCVKDLPELLKNHSEYEPIVPPPQATNSQDSPSQSIRRGRSSANVRVSANVNPQIRFQDSSYEGKPVLVTEGPYRGFVGEVDACIPGGWYLISGLFAEDALESQLAVSPQSIRLIRGSSKNQRVQQSSNAARSTNGGGFVKDFQSFLTKHFSAPIRSLKLRIEALQEEKQALNGQLVRIRSASSNAVVDASSSAGMVEMQNQEVHRLMERLQHVQSNLTKAENDLREQLQSVAAARLHVLQCFDQAEKEGK